MAAASSAVAGGGQFVGAMTLALAKGRHPAVVPRPPCARVGFTGSATVLLLLSSVAQ